MNKDDMEFFKLTESGKPTSGIILIDAERFRKEQHSYAYEEFKSANLIDNIATCRVFWVKGLPYPLIYGSSKKEDDPRDSLKSVINLIKQYKSFIALRGNFIYPNHVYKHFVYKGMTYNIDQEVFNKYIPIIKLFHQNWVSHLNKKMSSAEALMSAYNRNVTQVSQSSNKWADTWGYSRKFKFLEATKITYLQEVIYLPEKKFIIYKYSI